jgi:hypothetical protein
MTTDFQHVWPAMTVVKVIVIAEVNPIDGNEVILGKARVPLNPPVSEENMSPSKMKSILEKANKEIRWSAATFYYKGDNKELLRILDTEAQWPAPATGDGELMVWFSKPAEVKDESEKDDKVCLGRHLHMPDNKKAKTLTTAEFEGYCLLHAAGHGCLDCVQHWIKHGVNVNFQSTTQEHNAMDFILWARKEKLVVEKTANSVIAFLKEKGGEANTMKQSG